LATLLPALCKTEADRRRYTNVADMDVTAVVNDSHLAVPGSLFVALSGARRDGHDYIGAAAGAGAAFVLSERPVPAEPGVVHFVRPDARRKLGELAAAFHEDPSRALHVVGITGTNGKTTTSYRTRSVLEAAGFPTGLVGTIAYKIGDRTIPAANTTPDALVLQDLFAQMLDAALTHAAIEVSSHALDLHRVRETRFSTAVFTGLSDHEHLDYHGSFERYRAAKAKLFEMLEPDATAAINANDPEGPYMADRAHCLKLWFGLDTSADLSAEIRAMDMTGTRYRLDTPNGSADVRSPLLGDFNVMNDLAAAAAGLAAGAGLDAVVAGLERPDAVPGRLEKIPAADFHPLVDYAHNEGALESVLATVRSLAPRRLLVVFGAGGDRDRGKRPLMGAVAEKFCDRIFLTADNSRGEETLDIIREIQLGMSGSKPVVVVPDREMAIRAAVAAAEPGDVLLVAGKGHETYQILGPVKTPFDDREMLRQAVAEREAGVRQLARSEA